MKYGPNICYLLLYEYDKISDKEYWFKKPIDIENDI